MREGTACHPDDRRRRRAAWGTYYADDHPWNRCGAVLGVMQTVYRAELTAIYQVVNSALEPTHIVSDCESVVNCAADIFHNNHDGEHRGDHAELWESIHKKVEEKRPGHFKIAWVPSHMDLTKAKELQAKGGPEERMLVGNHWADREAKKGMQSHNIDWQEYQEADDRTFLACMSQHLIRTVWEDLFTLDMRLKLGLDDEEEEQETLPREREEEIEEQPLEAEEQEDPWEAEEEAARRLQNEPTGRRHPECPLAQWSPTCCFVGGRRPQEL